jgi:PKD repeat protein
MTLRQLVFSSSLAALACGPVPRPTADPGGVELTAKLNVPVDFDGSASRGQITSYEWDFGDGSERAAGVTTSHRFAIEGDFSVSLTVKGPGGVHTGTVLVHVGNACTARAAITVVTQSPQPGQPVELSSSGSGGCNGAALAEYHWEFGDGATEDGAQKASVSHTWAAKGSYPVVLRVVDVKGSEGRASRTLNVGVTAGKPLVTCPATSTAIAGKSASFSASGSDPGGSALSYSWTFSDDGSVQAGSAVQHTFATAGSFTATAVATTSDSRSSDPCVTAVTVTPPPSYTGSWLLNPMSTSMTGCSQFTVGFPATTIAITHSGSTMVGTPAGNGWPAGNYDLTGTEDGAPAAPGTFRIRKILPNETKGACGSVVPEHSVRLTFNSATAATGTWSVIFTASCLPTCSALCNCVATVDFSAIKQ